MFRKVMVPLDGSSFAEAALPLGRALAEHAGSDLELVTVHEPVPAFAQADWEASAREWSENYLEEVTRRLGEVHGPVESTVLAGLVAEQLEERAAETGTDLLVMATHGRGALSRAWLGSVADHFVRHSPCPVLLVRPEGDEEVDLASLPEIAHILVPLDGSSFSESVLEHAQGLARLFGANLTLVQVVVYPLEISSPYLPHTIQMNQQVVERARTSASEYLEEVAGRLRGDGTDTEVRVLVDTQAGHGILRAAEEVGADLITMSTHARKGVSRAFLGSATDKVVRGSRCPVFLVRPDRTQESSAETPRGRRKP